MKKSILKCGIIAAVMIMLIAISPEAIYADGSEMFEYEINNGSVTITGCDANVTELEIPSYIEGYPVKIIDDNAFRDNTNLTGVVMHSGVEILGNSLFCGCTNLKNVIIADSVYLIHGNAFRDCVSLTSITIPDSVTRLAEGIFMGCTALTDVKWGSGITSISGGMFANTGLTHITIPNSIVYIDNFAFRDCTNLKTVTVPDNVERTGVHLFSGCSNLESAVIGKGLTNISEGMFNECENLKNVTFSNNIKSIDHDAFRFCDSLTDVYFQGTENEWKEIAIDDSNYRLSYVNIHYLESVPQMTVNITKEAQEWLADIKIEDEYEEEKTVSVVLYDNNDKLIGCYGKLYDENETCFEIPNSLNAEYAKFYIWKGNMWPIMFMEKIYVN